MGWLRGWMTASGASAVRWWHVVGSRAIAPHVGHVWAVCLLCHASLFSPLVPACRCGACDYSAVQQLLGSLDAMPVLDDDKGHTTHHTHNGGDVPTGGHGVGGGGTAGAVAQAPGAGGTGAADAPLAASLKAVLCGPVLPPHLLTDVVLAACPPLRAYASGDGGAADMVAALVESCRSAGSNQLQQLALTLAAAEADDGVATAEPGSVSGVASALSSSDANDPSGGGRQRDGGRRVVGGRGKGTSVTGAPVGQRGRRTGAAAAAATTARGTRRRSGAQQRGRRSSATREGAGSDSAGGSDDNEDVSRAGDGSGSDSGGGDSSGSDSPPASGDDASGHGEESGDEDDAGQDGNGGDKRASRSTRRGGRGSRGRARGGTKRAAGGSGRGAKAKAATAKTTRLGARKSPQHQLLVLWKSINANKYALPFRQPVNRADAPGYDKIIKQPMDLSTIRARIESGASANLRPRVPHALFVKACVAPPPPSALPLRTCV